MPWWALEGVREMARERPGGWERGSAHQRSFSHVSTVAEPGSVLKIVEKAISGETRLSRLMKEVPTARGADAGRVRACRKARGTPRAAAKCAWGEWQVW